MRCKVRDQYVLLEGVAIDLSVDGVLQRTVHDLGQVIGHPHEKVDEVRIVQVL